MNNLRTKGSSERTRIHVAFTISTRQIANYLGITLSAFNKRKQRHNLKFKTKDPWEGFWNLVEYLEENGMRPSSGVGYADPLYKSKEVIDNSEERSTS